MRAPPAILRRLFRSQSGATAVEFALVCLPLLLLVFGIIEFGRAFTCAMNSRTPSTLPLGGC